MQRTWPQLMSGPASCSPASLGWILCSPLTTSCCSSPAWPPDLTLIPSHCHRCSLPPGGTWAQKWAQACAPGIFGMKQDGCPSLLGLAHQVHSAPASAHPGSRHLAAVLGTACLLWAGVGAFGRGDTDLPAPSQSSAISFCTGPKNYVVDTDVNR